MSEHDVTQESIGDLSAELNINQPIQTVAKHDGRVTILNAALADMAARNAVRLEHSRAISREGSVNITREKYRAKFGWTDAQFAEYWRLRDIPRMPGERQSRWERLLNREEKRAKAALKPPKNTKVKDMTPEDALAHHRKKNREKVARFRAKSAAVASAEGLAAGDRPLSDEELKMIALAEASQAPLSPEQIELAEILASLKAAEQAEEAAKESEKS